MFDFTIDRSKAVELANNLGLKVSFGASSPGIRINNGEDSMFFSIKEFFPELNSLEEIELPLTNRFPILQRI
jgi:hypothetical protein